jgi:serine/threonine protein phosphatase 1
MCSVRAAIPLTPPRRRDRISGLPRARPSSSDGDAYAVCYDRKAMVFKLLSRKSAPPPAPAAIPVGMRIYAVGDIHGCDLLLDQLLQRIDADNAARGPATSQLIFLGDLVDRGPASAQVVERLIALREQRPDTRFLLGNHEEIFLRAIENDARILPLFCRIGGRETGLSYGIPEDVYNAAGYAELAALLREAVPEHHIAFLKSFEDMIVIGDYAFVHAGVRPGRALDHQRTSDLRWIRDEFLDFRGQFDKLIVHGHTITSDVESLPNRIGLDTGAYASGILSAMGFERDERWVLQAGPEA